MDISVSKAKNTLNLKACQVLAKESTSKSFKPKVRNFGNQNVKTCCVKKQGNHQQPADPSPSSLLLQEGSGFSRSSSKLSSLEGVWQPRKGEKEEREERKLEKKMKSCAYVLKD